MGLTDWKLLDTSRLRDDSWLLMRPTGFPKQQVCIKTNDVLII